VRRAAGGQHCWWVVGRSVGRRALAAMTQNNAANQLTDAVSRTRLLAVRRLPSSVSTDIT